MTRFNAPFEIHIHGQIPLHASVDFDQLQDALRPIWKYAGARSLAEGANSAYEEEPGIRLDTSTHMLQICWTVNGGEDFRNVLDEMCANLNKLATQGSAIEVTFFDTDYDDDDEDDEEDSHDDFILLFVGPTAEAIMQAQRDLLVQDVIALMERHFDGSELSGVIAEVDQLFLQRARNLANPADLNRPSRSFGGYIPGSHRPRRLH